MHAKHARKVRQHTHNHPQQANSSDKELDLVPYDKEEAEEDSSARPQIRARVQLAGAMRLPLHRAPLPAP